MKTYIPDYYKNFLCIAGECKHSCCIGWEIDIDNETSEYYNSLSGDFGARLKDSITTEDNISYFTLSTDERCPFLNSNNLCDIILTLGEDKLCQICSDHPRFRNFFSDRTEMGLGLCCEAAAKLILTNPNKVKIIDSETNTYFNPESDDFSNFRNELFNIVQDRNLSINQRIKQIIDDYRIFIPQKSFSQWADFYSGLEYMNPESGAIISRIKNIDSDKYPGFSKPVEVALEQLLIYFLYRHLPDGIFDDTINERIAFSLLSTKIICAVLIADFQTGTDITISNLLEYARIYSSEIEYSEENLQNILDIFSEEK